MHVVSEVNIIESESSCNVMGLMNCQGNSALHSKGCVVLHFKNVLFSRTQWTPKTKSDKGRFSV